MALEKKIRKNLQYKQIQRMFFPSLSPRAMVSINLTLHYMYIRKLSNKFELFSPSGS
jgi:hypothetical protein